MGKRLSPPHSMPLLVVGRGSVGACCHSCKVTKWLEIIVGADFLLHCVNQVSWSD